MLKAELLCVRETNQKSNWTNFKFVASKGWRGENSKICAYKCWKKIKKIKRKQKFNKNEQTALQPLLVGLSLTLNCSISYANKFPTARTCPPHNEILTYIKTQTALEQLSSIHWARAQRQSADNVSQLWLSS